MEEKETRRRRRARWLRGALGLAVFGIVAFNVAAGYHARALMVFLEEGQRTPQIEKLTPLQKAAVLATGVRIPKPRNYRTPADERLAFDTKILRDPGRPDLEAWHIPCATSRAVVALFHGYADCKASLLAEARGFHDAGCEVWMLDFRGSGGSGGHATSLGWHEAEDVARLARFLRAERPGQPLLLAGFSMGGAAILRAVADLGVPADGIVVSSVFDTMLGALRQRFHTMGLPAFPGAECLLFWGGVQQDMNGFRNNPADFAARIRCPALVLHGALDPRAPLEQGRHIYDQLAGPKRLVVLEGAGHASFCRLDPAAWRHEMEAWLAGLTRGGVMPAGVSRRKVPADHGWMEGR